MGPPDENWSLPSWAKKTTEESPSGDILTGAAATDTTSIPEETPAAAAEFSNPEQNISRQAPPTPVPVSNRKTQPDSPSVFDIGLSDATIKMFVNKAKPQAANPSLNLTSSKALSASTSSSSTSRSSSRVTSAKPGGRDVPVSPSNFSCQAPDLEAREPGGHDSTVGASPELQLRSALPSLQVTHSNTLFYLITLVILVTFFLIR